jgi:hypothetical protein
MPPAKIAVSPPSMRILRASNSQEPGSRAGTQRGSQAPPLPDVRVESGTMALCCPALHRGHRAAARNRQSAHPAAVQQAAVAGFLVVSVGRPSRAVGLQGPAIRSRLASATSTVPGQEHQGASLASSGPASKPLSPGCRLSHRTAALHLLCTAALWLDAQCHTLLLQCRVRALLLPLSARCLHRLHPKRTSHHV